MCSECGKKISFGFLYEGNLCGACKRKQDEAIQRHQKQTVLQAERPPSIQDAGANDSDASDEDSRVSDILSVLVTTETHTNLNIVKRIDIVISSATFALDINVDKMRGELIYTIKKSAAAIGANAVVGLTITVTETYSASAGVGNFKTFRALAVGTAVIVDAGSGPKS